MTEHGAASDEWPALYPRILAADILVIAGPIWLGDNSSVTKQVIERLYGNSHLLNDAGQYAYYGRVGGCLITGNEDGVKHCAQNVLYSGRPAASRRTATSGPSGTPAAGSTSPTPNTAERGVAGRPLRRTAACPAAGRRGQGRVCSRNRPRSRNPTPAYTRSAIGVDCRLAVRRPRSAASCTSSAVSAVPSPRRRARCTVPTL
jgi:NADPH-dependent FMN reductase